MVYIDRIGHLAADTNDELHAMAKRLGLPRRWLQSAGTEREHYDLTTPNARQRAVAAGAVEVGIREMPAIVRRMNGEAHVGE